LICHHLRRGERPSLPFHSHPLERAPVEKRGEEQFNANQFSQFN
jgi:hypothetical protein